MDTYSINLGLCIHFMSFQQVDLETFTHGNGLKMPFPGSGGYLGDLSTRQKQFGVLDIAIDFNISSMTVTLPFQGHKGK